MSDAVDRARRYLRRELDMGRDRLILPRALPEAPARVIPMPERAISSPAPSSGAPASPEAAPSASASPQRSPASPRRASGEASASSRRSPSATAASGDGAGSTGGGGAAGGGASDGGDGGAKTFPPLRGLRSDDEVARAADRLAPIHERAQGCVACALHETRNTVVFGTGSARSGIVFVGEAPGAQEDEKGIPFVGRAGQLLDKILAAIGVARDDVYICNVLKCRPPNNRDPQPLEAATCTPFLRDQLEALEPKVICALGRHAARWLLQSNAPMGKLRGTIHRYQEIPTIATYHPAALLRNPQWKRAAWEDFQLLRKIAEDGPEAAGG